ncbi:kinase-like protein [Thelephora ganbajun]|uniref:Kinase-like protein n=1 Tax=Thelephora ganbajun TaxID=370292 RepID=A0ACB6ZES0_THEGA|nr:kinase-like protein [Thelephora ganbajun]
MPTRRRLLDFIWLSRGPSVLHIFRGSTRLNYDLPPASRAIRNFDPTLYHAQTVWPSYPLPRTMLSPSTSYIVLSLPNAKQLEAGDFDLDELSKKLTEALVDESQRNEILRLTGDIAVLVTECLDKVMSSENFRANSDIQTRSNVLYVFSRLSRGCQYLPHSYWIDPRTITLPSEPYTSGTCAGVYRGRQNDEPVAVKVLMIPNQESMVKLKKRFHKEAILWKHVSCPYILKFNGAFYHNDMPAIVMPWVPHGNIIEYLEKHTGVDRLHLLLGVVKGVRYLHNCNIAHGDIKPPNILISDSTPPRAMLADFGFTRVTTISAKMSSEEGPMAFIAPELLSTRLGLDRAVPSKEADIFALAMTIYQVLTGKCPFSQMREARIIGAVISGERPTKPGNAKQIGMTNAVWDLLRECWRDDRTKRPTISVILRRFCDTINEAKTTDSRIEEAGLRLDFTDNHGSFRSETTLVRCELGDVAPESPQSAECHCFPPWKRAKRIFRFTN